MKTANLQKKLFNLKNCNTIGKKMADFLIDLMKTVQFSLLNMPKLFCYLKTAILLFDGD